MSARTVPLKVSAGGHLSLAHPLASPDALPTGHGYIVAINGIPATAQPGAVLLAFGAVCVHWPAGTAPEHRRMSWGAIAWRERSAIVRPEPRP